MKVRVDFGVDSPFCYSTACIIFFMVYMDKVLYTDTFMPIITKI